MRDVEDILDRNFWITTTGCGIRPVSRKFGHIDFVKFPKKMGYRHNGAMRMERL